MARSCFASPGLDLTLCPICCQGRMGVVAEIDPHDAVPAHVAILGPS